MPENISHSRGRDDESPEERYDRELLELLNEVRVAMPGVQVLFGFLLAVPFQQGFQNVTSFQRTLYFVTLLCSAAATVFLVVPVAYHRLMFRRRDKPAIVGTGNVSLIIGLLFLALAMNGAVILVTDVIYEKATVVITSICVGTVFAVLWFGIGLARRLSGERSW